MIIFPTKAISIVDGRKLSIGSQRPDVNGLFFAKKRIIHIRMNESIEKEFCKLAKENESFPFESILMNEWQNKIEGGNGFCPR